MLRQFPAIATIILAVCLPLPANPAATVSRETQTFFRQLDEAARLAATGRTAEAQRLAVPWLDRADTANRTARFLVEILPPDECLRLAPDGSANGALLQFHALFAAADPQAIQALALVLERNGDLFSWENSLIQHLDEPLRARMATSLASGIARYPANPFLRTALSHLATESAPPDFPEGPATLSVRDLDNLFVQGEILYRSGRPEAAEKRTARCAELARQAGDTWRTIDCLVQLTQHRLARGTPAEARRHLDEATRLLTRFNLPGPRRLTAFARGMLAIHEGDAATAIARFRDVLPSGKPVPANRLQASALVNLGYLLDETGRLVEALQCYQEAVAFYRSRRDGLALATALLDRGALRDRLNMPEAARADFEAVIHMPHLAPDDPDRLMALGNLANIHASYHQWDKALPLYQEALGAYASGRQWAEAALVAANLSRCHLLKGDSEAARRAIAQSREWLRQAREPLVNPRVLCLHAEYLLESGAPEKALAILDRLPALCQTTGAGSSIWELDFFRGEALVKLGRRREAHQCFFQALEGFHRAQEAAGDAMAELHFIGHGADVVEAILANILVLQEESGDEGFLQEAFLALAGYRGRVLHRQMAAQSDIFPPRNDAISLAAAQQILRRRQAFACCFFQGFHQVYLLWLDGQTTKLHRLTSASELKRAVQECEPDPERPTGQIDLRAVERLSRLVLAPLANAPWAECRELLILPDGHLFKIPFEILVRPGFSPNRDNRLGLSLPIFYLPSWQFLDGPLQPSIPSTPSPPAFLGLHGSTGERAFPYPLIWAEREVTLGANAFPWSPARLLPVDSLVHPPTRQALTATSWQIAHLASHIKVDEDNPWNSQIQAGGTEDRPVVLTLRDLQNARLKARLLILSGCSSGRGRAFPGEGNFSLGRAFLLGGCRSILLTFWPVADRGAFELMNRFYRELGGNGGHPARALLAARRQLSREPALSEPYFWAGYAFYGYPPAIDLPPTARTASSSGYNLGLAGYGLVYLCLLWRVVRRNGKPRKD